MHLHLCSLYFPKKSSTSNLCSLHPQLRRAHCSFQRDSGGKMPNLFVKRKLLSLYHTYLFSQPVRIVKLEVSSKKQAHFKPKELLDWMNWIHICPQGSLYHKINTFVLHGRQINAVWHCISTSEVCDTSKWVPMIRADLQNKAICNRS